MCFRYLNRNGIVADHMSVEQIVDMGEDPVNSTPHDVFTELLVEVCQINMSYKK